MSDGIKLSFCELRQKEVINSSDGKRLGRIIDLVFACDSGRISGIVVPYSKKTFIFRNTQQLFIPWQNVIKVGEDVILVRLSPIVCEQRRRHKNSGCDYNDSKIDDDCEPTRNNNKCADDDDCSRNRPSGCDKQCEKCMLFDCVYRWKNHREHKGGEDGIYVNGDESDE